MLWKLGMKTIKKGCLLKTKRYLFCLNNKPDPNQNSNRQYKFPEKKEVEGEEEEIEDGSYKDKSKTPLYAFTLASSFLVFLYGLQQMNKMKAKTEKSKATFKEKHFGKPLIGGSWELLDVNGNSFSSKNLQGQYYIIYFGFCQCPDICPQSMNKLSKAYDIIKNSSEKQFFDLKLVFVSVDPDRDSNDKIKKFLSYFDGKFIGVTGKYNEDPNLKEMLKKFKIYATKIEYDVEEDNTTKSSYTLDHTVISYLMSDKNEYLDHLGSSLNAQDMARKIIDDIMENEHTNKLNQ